MSVIGKKPSMETIVEVGELDDPNHPLLLKSVLTRLFGYLSVPELKMARRVSLAWREWATPYLQMRSIVRLKGTCDLCKSEWNVKKKLPHDHRETISLYRFVLQLHALTVGERDRLFFRNFLLEDINLYLIGRLNTDCTAYFLRLAKFFGSKVFQLHLQNVQLCPSDSLKTLMAMFRNVEVVTVEGVQIWQDPLFPSDESSRVLPPAANELLTSLCFYGDSTFENSLDWKGILQQCPNLKEVKLEEAKITHVNNFVAALSLFTPPQLERLRVRKLTLVPRNDPLEEFLENGLDDPTVNDLSLSIHKIQWASALTSILQSVPIQELKLRLPYSDDSYEVIQALQGVNSFLNILSLGRSSFVSAGEAELTFKPRPWEITQEHWIQLPFVHTLEIAHNLVESLDEIKHVFPGLERLTVFVLPTEVRGGKGKPYLTYLHTNLILSMRNASALKNVRHLEWNVQEARDAEGKRTVVYRSRALRHLPRLFPNLATLRVSISEASELQCIFRHMATLEELTLLSNSLYRVKDEDICGEDLRIPSGGSALARAKKESDAPIGQGIKQLKLLKRLSFESNTSHLTDRSIYEGFISLRYLRSLHISKGKKLTFRGLRMLRKCRYLVYVNVTDVKDEGIRMTHVQDGPLEEEPEEELPDLPVSQASEQVDINLGPISKIPMRVTNRKVMYRHQRQMLSHQGQMMTVPYQGQTTIIEELDTGRLPILVAPKEKAPKAMKMEKKVEDFVLPPLTQYPTSNVQQGAMDVNEHAEGLKELETLWKKRQERIIKKGGKYELGCIHHKIGGRRYDYLRTTYKVNGRMYQLVRRIYEDDKQGDNIQAKHRAWKENERRKRLQAEMDALSDVATTTEQDDAKSEYDSESEYERSVRENDEDDDLEEYCDEDEDGPPPPSETSAHSSDTDETFEEEGVCTDDSWYEADKEFYDSSAVEESESEEESDSSEKQLSEASLDKGFVSESSGSGRKKKLKKKLRFEDSEVQGAEETKAEERKEARQEEEEELEEEDAEEEEDEDAEEEEEGEAERDPTKEEHDHLEEPRAEIVSDSEYERYEESQAEGAEESEYERFHESQVQRAEEAQTRMLEESQNERSQESEDARVGESEDNQDYEPENVRFNLAQAMYFSESDHVHSSGSEHMRPYVSERLQSRASEPLYSPLPERLYSPVSERLHSAPSEQRFPTSGGRRFPELEHVSYTKPELPRFPGYTQFPNMEDLRFTESERIRFSELQDMRFQGEDDVGSSIPGSLGMSPQESDFHGSEIMSLQDTQDMGYEPAPRDWRFAELTPKRLGQSKLEIMEESETKRFEESHSGRIEKTTYERFEKSKYERFENSKYERVEKSKYERFNGSSQDISSGSSFGRSNGLPKKRISVSSYDLSSATSQPRLNGSSYGRKIGFLQERLNGSSYEHSSGSPHARLNGSSYDHTIGSPQERLHMSSQERPMGSPYDQPIGSSREHLIGSSRGHYSQERLNRSPYESRSASPMERSNASTQERLSESSHERHTGSPLDRRGGSPRDRHTGSPLDRRGGSPRERHTGSPYDRHGGSALARVTESPYEHMSGSPQHQLKELQIERLHEDYSEQDLPESSTEEPIARAQPRYSFSDSEPYKYYPPRSAPTVAYKHFPLDPINRRVHSQCDSRRESMGSSGESTGMYPAPTQYQYKSLPAYLQKRNAEETLPPWEEYNSKSGKSNSNSSNGSLSKSSSRSVLSGKSDADFAKEDEREALNSALSKKAMSRDGSATGDRENQCSPGSEEEETSLHLDHGEREESDNSSVEGRMYREDDTEGHEVHVSPEAETITPPKLLLEGEEIPPSRATSAQVSTAQPEQAADEQVSHKDQSSPEPSLILEDKPHLESSF